MSVNQDNPHLFIVLTDENQILYATNSALDAYAQSDAWEAAHAAEAQVVECSWVDGFPGWKPILPPNADISWDNTPIKLRGINWEQGQ